MATKKKTTKKSGSTETLVDVLIEPIAIQILPVELIGTSPLMMHAWSAKAKEEMLSKQKTDAPKARAIRNPEQDVEDALYRMTDGPSHYGFPSIAFKKATVSATRNVPGMTMTLLRGAFHIYEDLVPIFGEYEMSEDMVRVGQGTADLRYRPKFIEWRTKFDVHFNAGVITPSQLISMLNLAGFAVGVGEWRPEKDGRMGMFRVATEGDK